MSSPFTQFRRRQKAYLAVLGVMCMVAFVFGGVTCSNDQPAQADPVVASTKYGELHESRLAYMRSNLELVNNFLSGLVVRVADKTMQTANFPPQFRNQLLQFQLQRLEQEGLLTDSSEATAVDVMILSNKAAELGVVVSDAAISEFINQQTNNQLSREEIAEEVARWGATPRRLYDALHDTLLAVRVRYLFGRGLMAAPPAQQWEYYQRLNRYARTEVVPVSVASFVSEVPDPGEEVLRKFFEENKNRVAQPGSPEPGFKQPHQVALQYLRAEYDKFYDEAAVTDEEIAQHYEKNLKNYPYTDPPLELPKTEEEQKDSAEKPESTEKPESKEECQSPDQPESKPADTKPAETKPAEVKEVTSPATSDAEKPAQQPADAAPATTLDTVPKETETGPSLLDLTSQYGLPRDIRGGKKPEVAPLWNVTDRIRRELAGDRARKKIEETFAEVRPLLDRFYNDFALWRSEHPAGADASSQPPRPDFVALAKKHGLSAHEIGLSSLHHVLTETEIGQAIAGRGATFMQQTLQTPPVFKQQSVQDTAGNQYLFWKNQDVPEHVPSIDDAEIRRQVLASWKMIEARSLAQKRAEELAEKARPSKQSLSIALAEEKDVKVTEAGPFTWMTQGNPMLGPQEPRLTTVPGVDTPGTDFMRAVFDLSEGEVGVAFNAPKTNLYVIRVTTLEPAPRVLREKFLAETPNQQQQQTYSAISFEEHLATSRKWIEEVRTTAGLHWKREAYTASLR